MAGVFIDMPGDFVIDSLSLPDYLKYSTGNINAYTAVYSAVYKKCRYSLTVMNMNIPFTNCSAWSSLHNVKSHSSSQNQTSSKRIDGKTILPTYTCIQKVKLNY